MIIHFCLCSNASCCFPGMTRRTIRSRGQARGMIVKFRGRFQGISGQIYCRGLLLKTIYERGSLLKQIVRGVFSVRGCRHWHWREAWTVNDNGGIRGATIRSSGTGWLGERRYRHWCWRDRLSRREEGVPPLVLAGRANVDSPAIGTCGTLISLKACRQ